jgi:uncharacterized membrane protein
VLERCAMTRVLVIGAALAFIAGFAFLTFVAIVEQGFTLASLLSVLVLVLLGVGTIAAARNPPK